MATRRRPSVWFVRLAVPLALLFVATPWGAAQSATQPSSAAPGFLLYLATGLPPATGYAAIDPRTLADLPGAASFTAGSDPGWALVSEDGSTVALVAPDSGQIETLDLRTGRARGRFTLPAEASLWAVSDDGTRLVVEGPADPSVVDSPWAWSVVDSSTGRVVLTIKEPGLGAQGIVIDPLAWRMYRLYDGSSPTVGADLVATDLTTGAESGAVVVPDLPMTPANGEQPAPGVLWHALALSPDGQKLAIVHADRNAVTLIATQPLRLERTIEFGRGASVWDRVAAFLPLWPQPAAAKGSGGTWRGAVFATDGRHLYVYGDRFTPDGEPFAGPTGETEHQLVWHGLGLTGVDLASGAATATVLSDERIDRVLPAPDGRGVYVANYPPGLDSPPSTFHLRRLDATSLRPLAERTLARFGDLVLIPAGSNASPAGG